MRGGGGKWSGRIGGLSFMCECAQGELSSMRTGDTASYLLYDFLFSLVFHLLALSSCVCVCFFMLIFCYFFTVLFYLLFQFFLLFN